MTVWPEHSLDRPQKVVAYIVRDERIVVLRHADHPWDQAGLQVPAGTLRPGETPEASGMRGWAVPRGRSTITSSVRARRVRASKNASDVASVIDPSPASLSAATQRALVLDALLKTMALCRRLLADLRRLSMACESRTSSWFRCAFPRL